jgi:restriction endonuclease Mrr
VGQPSSQILADWLKQELSGAEWVGIKQLCLSALMKNWTSWNEATASELVEVEWTHVAEHLRNEISDRRIDGSVLVFEIDNEQIPYIRATNDDTSKVLKRLRESDPRFVEILCSRILEKLGANSQVTQQTHDGGVDFFGTKLNIVPGGLNVPDACKALVIGQTKRYKNNNIISETMVREFVGAATLRRHILLKEGKAGPMSPFIFVYWTTSSFDPRAKSYAREIGLWYMDGMTFANYINHLGLAGSLL